MFVLNRACNQFNDVFGAIFLVQFLVCALLVCINVFLFVITSDVTQKIKNVMFAVTILVRTLLTCMMGDKVIEQSQDIGYAAYDTDWTNFSLNEKKIILFIMLQAYKAKEIRASLFFKYSLLLFSDAMKSTYTYFNIISNIYSVHN